MRKFYPEDLKSSLLGSCTKERIGDLLVERKTLWRKDTGGGRYRKKGLEGSRGASPETQIMTPSHLEMKEEEETA